MGTAAGGKGYPIPFMTPTLLYIGVARATSAKLRPGPLAPCCCLQGLSGCEGHQIRGHSEAALYVSSFQALAPEQVHPHSMTGVARMYPPPQSIRNPPSTSNHSLPRSLSSHRRIVRPSSLPRPSPLLKLVINKHFNPLLLSSLRSCLRRQLFAAPARWQVLGLRQREGGRNRWINGGRD
jgi:hypothetical protein